MATATAVKIGSIKVFCKKYLNREANCKLLDGTFESYVNNHIKEFGESPTGVYNLRYHGDGTTITIWNAK